MGKTKRPDSGRRDTPIGEIRAMEGGDNVRRFSLSFSSEEAYERWFGREILSHTEGAVDLGRLKEMGPVLFNHDRDAVVGKVLDARVENGRGVAEIEFDSDEASETIREKVLGGSLRGVSVGYKVTNWETVEAGFRSLDGRFEGPCEIAVRWEPLEISIVSVPADATVGIGRDIGDIQENTQEDEGMEENKKTMPAAEKQTHVVSDAGAEKAASEKERKRSLEITTICREYDLDAAGYIESGVSVDDVRKEALEVLKKRAQQNETDPVNIALQADEKDKFSRAMSDALILRAGVQRQEKPADGASDLRAMSLRDISREALVRLDGLDAMQVMRMDNDTLMRQFFTPTSMIPSIFDATIEKSYRAGYSTLPATFETWTREGTLSDFKQTHYQYRANAAGEFLRVPEGGELKHDIPQDEMTPTRGLNTYGRQFTMSREAFYNDDIGYLTTVPARYAASAKRTLNAQVYSILAQNPAIYDGVNLFDVAHKNAAATAGALNINNLSQAIRAMRTQKNSDGQMIGATPRFLVVPVAQEMMARTLLAATTVRTTSFSTGETEIDNPLKQYGLQVVAEPELDARLASGEEYAWFLLADANTVDTVQVDYLNGNKYPTFRRMEKPGQLGFVWDIFLDWGVSVLDYKGMYKNAGSAPANL